MTNSQDESWIMEQGWEIKTIPEDSHTELLEFSLKEYADIWQELAKP